MKTSLAWLNQYVDPPATAEEAIEALSSVGFPDDGTELVPHSDGSSDTRIDFEVTSNRGDCLSHVGLARELAAATGRQLRQPKPQLPQADAPAVGSLASVENQAPDLCPVYSARVITGVKVGPSPAWLVHRLEAAGLRSINNIVDITNFVLLELGQPLHAFDLSRLSGRRIVVRRAAAGEPFTAIDGSKHKLTAEMLVIADDQKPQAIAGVMGGLESEVSEGTTDVLLESARFAPLSIRKTSRTLKLSSDSSYRYERGVDPLGVEAASQRAAALIVELAGGTLAQGVLRVGEDEPQPAALTMRIARCNALLGLDLSPQRQLGYLEQLGLTPVIDGEVIRVTAPTFRLDLKREVDLIEEVARHFGLDAVPVHEKISIVTQRRQSAVAAGQVIARALIAHGYHQTITPSFIGRKQAQAFCPAGESLLQVEEDRRATDPCLRPSVLPSLLECRKLNQDRGNRDVKLFEIADSFGRASSGAVRETPVLAMLADAEDPSSSVRSMRGALEELVGAVGGPASIDSLRIVPAAADACFATAASIQLGGKTIGQMGLLAPPQQKAFGLQTAVALLEVAYPPLVALYPPARGSVDLPRFPAIERDLSVVVAEGITWANIEVQVRSTRPALLESLRFLTTYRGKPIEKGRKSVSFRMVFRDASGTLRHEQVDPQVEAVVQALKQALNAEQRV